MKVLLIDDETELLESLSERLDIRGIESDKAGDADKAIELVHKNDYDVVVLDLLLGDVNGLDLLEKLREIRPGLKVIVVSGREIEEETERARVLGVLDVFLKPLPFNDLLARLKEAAGEDG